MSETRATEVIFRARGLTKVYRMGDVEVRALRGSRSGPHPGKS